MNVKNTKKLFMDFPNLYRGKGKPLTKSLMAFGFGCGDGWFDLIYELSKKIAAMDLNGEVEATQVKEKFGGLRFYVNAAPKEIHDLIGEYEEKSFETCEVCGALGKFRDDLSWVQTLCAKHYGKLRGK